MGLTNTQYCVIVNLKYTTVLKKCAMSSMLSPLIKGY